MKTNREKSSRLFLSPQACLKRLGKPCVYDLATDELYEIDEEAAAFLRRCADGGVVSATLSEAERNLADFCLEEGLLRRSVRAPTRRFAGWTPEGNAPDLPLKYLELQITHRCNLRCGHCYLGPPQASDLPVETIRTLLGELETMQGLRVLVSGGEPTLHPSFDRINRMLPDYGLRAVLLTNGTTLTAAGVRKLTFQEAQVSLDGMEEGHDILRGPGRFQQTVTGMNRLRDAGIDVSVATVIHRGNLEEMDRLETFLKDFGVWEWSVDTLCLSGRLDEASDLRVDDAVSASRLNYGFGGSLHEGSGNLTCGAGLMTILPDGSACKCGYYASEPVGTAPEGLETLWARIEHPPLTSLSCDCTQRDLCRGGCRYRARLAGDPSGPDPVKCHFFGVTGKEHAEKTGLEGI